MTAAKVKIPTGAIACIDRIMRRSLGRSLTSEQSFTLWLECRSHLFSIGARKFVREIEGADGDGGLDTYVREFLMDAISQVLASMDWPMNMTPEVESNRFSIALRASMNSRGYAKLPELP